MRRQHRVHDLVYQQLFPNPTPTDPPDFHQHLVRNLITEVRVETHRFYGGLETIEAKYPGLNYAYPPHRKRLARFPYHAMLFEAFDALELTPYEIGELCKWEGTLWARQRYERDEGVKVSDTTGSEIKPWVRVKNRNASGHKRNASGHIKQQPSRIVVGEERRIPTEVDFIHPQPQIQQPHLVPIVPAWYIPVTSSIQPLPSSASQNGQLRSGIEQTATVFVTTTSHLQHHQTRPIQLQAQQVQIQQATTPVPDALEESCQKDDEMRPIHDTPQLVQVFQVPTALFSPIASTTPSLISDSTSGSSASTP